MRDRGRLTHVPGLAHVQVRARHVCLLETRLASGHPGEARRLDERDFVMAEDREEGALEERVVPADGLVTQAERLVGEEAGDEVDLSFHGTVDDGRDPTHHSELHVRDHGANRSEERPAVHHDTDGVPPSPAGDSTVAVMGSSSSWAKVSWRAFDRSGNRRLHAGSAAQSAET